MEETSKYTVVLVCHFIRSSA